MLRRPPRSTRTYTLFHYTTLFRSSVEGFRGIGDELVIIAVAVAGLGQIICGSGIAIRDQDIAGDPPEFAIRGPADAFTAKGVLVPMRLYTCGLGKVCRHDAPPTLTGDERAARVRRQDRGEARRVRMMVRHKKRAQSHPQSNKR